MANSTKQNLTTLGQIQSDTQSAYLSAPMIAAPFTSITDLSGNTRQMRDPSKTLRPAMGIERIHTKTIKLISDEKGTNGEQVWGLSKSDDRIRLVGNWSQVSDSYGPRPVSSGVANTDYIEISFYGTGLNVLMLLDTNARTMTYSLDGAAPVSLTPNSASNVLGNRNYPSNIAIPIVSNQTYGLHTVKILGTAALSINPFGFAILNESSSISIPKGEIVSAGRKEVISAATTTAYNSGFDGSPALNGRGGHVVKYIKNGIVGKVIQQTDSSQANLTSADHTNEDIIRRTNWREFGVNFSTDFTTVSTPGTTSRSYTLDDGSTSLAALVVVAQTTASGADGLTPASLNAYFTLTFVGTGLDVIREDFAATIDTHTVTVDGVAIGNLASTGIGKPTLTKIVSGLPYGSHTVKIMRTTNASVHIYFTDFIVYGPKKPSIPTGSTEIGEYYLMANYDASAVTGTALNDNAQMPIGVLSKCPVREVTYLGTGWSVQPPGAVVSTLPHGLNVQSATLTDSVSCTFFGTGIHLHLTATSTSTYNFTVTIDSVLNASGTNLVSVTNAVPAGTYTSTTLNNGFPARLAFTGLTLGTHTVKITKTTGAGPMAIGAMNIITPIHFPDSKRGSLALKPAISFPKQMDMGGIDLSKAKAWLQYDTAALSIIASYNISGVVQRSTANLLVFFEKPFRTDPVCIIETSAVGSSTAIYGIDGAVTGQSNKLAGVTILANAAPNRFYLVCFGELAGEDEE